MNKSSVFSAQRSTSFQILYCVLVRYTRIPNQTLHGNKESPLSALAKMWIERWNPLFAVTQVMSTVTTTDSLKAHTQQATQSGTMTKLGLFQEWKADKSMDDGTGQPVETEPQQFIIGTDETESELSMGSRSCLNRVNDQVRKRQKRSSMNECYRKRRKAFYDLVNVHVCNIGIISIHGKELLGQLSFHHEYKRRHIETNVRHICKIGVWTRWDLWSGNNWLGESFMEVPVIDWLRKSYQSSTHEGLRLFGFYTREPPIKRCMGR